MCLQEMDPVHATIIALACGIGKTLTTLLMIKITNERQRQAELDNPRDIQAYRATLVVCPGASVEVWLADIEKFFPGLFTIHQFYGTEVSVTNPSRLKCLVLPPTIGEFNRRCEALDPRDPQVSTPFTWDLIEHIQ
jgi:hypothetical protein